MSKVTISEVERVHHIQYLRPIRIQRPIVVAKINWVSGLTRSAPNSQVLRPCVVDAVGQGACAPVYPGLQCVVVAVCKMARHVNRQVRTVRAIVTLLCD